MRTIIKWSFVIWCFTASVLQAQTIQLRIPDSTGVKGSSIDIPVYVDSSVTGKNILSYQLKINYYSPYASITNIITTGTMSAGFASPSYNANTNTNILTVSAAGSTVLTGTGILFYIRLQLLQPYSMGMNFTGVTDCYFNQGTPVMNFKGGTLTISNPPTITTYFSSTTPLTLGDSVQVYVSGGTSPYTYAAVKTSVGTVTSTGMFKAIGVGKTKVRAQSANALVDTTDDDIEVRALRLTLPDTTILPLSNTLFPIRINSTNSSAILSGSFRINYSQGTLIPDSIITTGTLLQGATVSYQNFAGYTVVSFATSNALTGAGDLIKLRLKILIPQSSYLQLQDILFNQNIIGNKKDGSLFFTSIPTLSISPNYGDWFVNQTQQFTASGGKSPYSYSVSDTSKASINSAGIMTVKNGGVIKVSVKDSLNTIVQTNNLQLNDAAFSIPNMSVISGTYLNMPIFISNYTGNKSLRSFQLTLTYGSNVLDSVDIITTNTLTSGWTIVKNIMANKIVLAFAGTNTINTNGILFRLKGKVISAGSFYISSSDLMFNEGNFFTKNTDGLVSIVTSIQSNIGINSTLTTSSCTKTNQEIISASIYNYGNQTLFIGDTVFVGYKINTNSAIKDTFILTSNLSQYGSATFDFKTKANLSAVGSYNFKVYTSMLNDIDRTNDTSATTVSVYGNPTVNLGNDTTICDSSILVLNAANNGQYYLWNTGATTQTINADSTLKYWVKVTTIYNCSGADTIQVTEVPKPTKSSLSAAAGYSVCGLDSVVLSTPLNATYKYRWQLNGVNTSNNSDTLNKLVVRATGTYTVLVTNANGCSSLMKDTSLVFPSTRQQAPTITGNTKICEGDTLKLNASTLSNVTYRWTGPSAFAATTQNIQRPNALTNMSGTYAVYAIKNGATSTCDTSVSTQVSVNVYTKPTVQGLTVNGSLQLCNGDTVKLSVAQVIGNSYRWLKNGTNTSNNGDTLNVLAVNSGGLYTVRVTNNNGCASTMRDTSVNVIVKQAAPSITGNNTICEGDTLKLNASTLTGVTYRWNGPASYFATSQNIQRPNSDSSMAGVYAVYAIKNGALNNCDTSNATQVPVTINKKPVVIPITVTGNTTFCGNDSVTLSVTPQSGIALRWLKNGVNTINNADTSNVFVAKTSGLYSVRKTNASGCSSVMNSVNVTANTKPVTSAISGNGIVLIGSTQFYQVNNTTGSSYNWIINNGIQVSGTTTNQISVQWPTVAGSGAIKVVETSANGCKGDTVTKLIVISTSVPDSLILATDTVQLGPNADSTIVPIKANKNWSITNAASWLTITPMSGTTDDTLHIRVSQNTGATRSTLVTVTLGSLSRTIFVIQASATVNDSLAFNKDTVFYESAGGLDSIRLLSNRSWTLSDTASWLSTVPSSGTGTTSITLLATANLAITPRYAIVIGIAGTKVKSFIVAQKGATSGIAELRKMNSITIYPNPSEGIFTMENKSNESYQVVVYDMTGKRLDTFVTRANDAASKDYSHLKSGVYLIQVIGTETVQTLKLILNK